MKPLFVAVLLVTIGILKSRAEETCSKDSCQTSSNHDEHEGIGRSLVEDGEVLFCKAMERLLEMPPHSKPQSVDQIKPHLYLFRKGVNAPAGQAACDGKGGFTVVPYVLSVVEASQEDRTEFGRSLFAKGNETEILVTAHGFEGSLCNTLSWSQPLIENLMEARPDGAVLFIDWQLGANHPFEVEHPLKMYEQPAVNTQSIGQIAADVLLQIAGDVGVTLNPSKIHAIGFSLGAHAVSFFCKEIAAKLAGGSKCGRMTALDPAGPDFHHRDATMRVDVSDADFVDVYHTTFCIGLDQQLGHVNFDLNDIHATQPGCHEVFTPQQEKTPRSGAKFTSSNKAEDGSASKASEAMNYITDHMGGCSHETAARFYAKSILGSLCKDCDAKCYVYQSKTIGFGINPNEWKNQANQRFKLTMTDQQNCWYKGSG